MSLTPDQIKNMRERDAAEVRARISETERAVASLKLGIGTWADSVRASAELRYEPDAADAVLWAAPDYSAALDAVSEITAAAEKLAAAAEAFNVAEKWIAE